MSFKVEGVDDLVKKLQDLNGISEEMLAKSLMAGALVLETGIKVSMQQTSRGGKTYSRGGKSHVSSTPGQPPAVDYGFLINTVTSEQEDNDAIVYTNAENAAALEFGTATMQARPFMRPAADKQKGAVQAAIEVTAKRLVKK